MESTSPGTSESRLQHNESASSVSQILSTESSRARSIRNTNRPTPRRGSRHIVAGNGDSSSSATAAGEETDARPRRTSPRSSAQGERPQEQSVARPRSKLQRRNPGASTHDTTSRRRKKKARSSSESDDVLSSEEDRGSSSDPTHFLKLNKDYAATAIAACGCAQCKVYKHLKKKSTKAKTRRDGTDGGSAPRHGKSGGGAATTSTVRCRLFSERSDGTSSLALTLLLRGHRGYGKFSARARRLRKVSSKGQEAEQGASQPDALACKYPTWSSLSSATLRKTKRSFGIDTSQLSSSSCTTSAATLLRALLGTESGTTNIVFNRFQGIIRVGAPAAEDHHQRAGSTPCMVGGLVDTTTTTPTTSATSASTV